jgi:hypothetical protein
LSKHELDKEMIRRQSRVVDVRIGVGVENVLLMYYLSKRCCCRKDVVVEKMLLSKRCCCRKDVVVEKMLLLIGAVIRIVVCSLCDEVK